MRCKEEFSKSKKNNKKNEMTDVRDVSHFGKRRRSQLEAPAFLAAIRVVGSGFSSSNSARARA